MKDLTASQLTNQAMIELAHRACFVWRNNNLAVRGRAFIGLKGVPDIVGFQIHTGVAVYCEVKTVNDKMSEYQIEFMIKAKQAGCFCLVATDNKGSLKLTEWQYD